MTIKQLREKTGLSQNKFAEKYHLSVRSLQRWERGQTPTPEFVLFALNTIINMKKH